VTPHDFNEFLIAFGGGNPKVAYLNVRSFFLLLFFLLPGDQNVEE
jgi:hypothetical protein